MVNAAGALRRAVRLFDVNILVAAHAVCLLLSAFVFTVAPAQAQETETILHWKNGDVLPGTLIEINASQVRWSSSLFSEKLIIPTKALDSMFFPKQTLQPTEAFRIGTTSSDVFTAELVGSDENTLVFSSKRLGQVRINRGVIYSLSRRMHPNLAFDGSRFEDWELNLDGPIKDDEGTTWRRGPGGHAKTDLKKTALFRTIRIPKQFAIDLELASAVSPRFVMALGKDPSSAESDQALKLETWDNELVVVQDTVFEPVMTLGDNQHEVRLRLSFDSDSGELHVVDAAGRSLLSARDGSRSPFKCGTRMNRRQQR